MTDLQCPGLCLGSRGRWTLLRSGCRSCPDSWFHGYVMGEIEHGRTKNMRISWGRSWGNQCGGFQSMEPLKPSVFSACFPAVWCSPVIHRSPSVTFVQHQAYCPPEPPEEPGNLRVSPQAVSSSLIIPKTLQDFASLSYTIPLPTHFQLSSDSIEAIPVDPGIGPFPSKPEGKASTAWNPSAEYGGVVGSNVSVWRWDPEANSCFISPIKHMGLSINGGSLGSPKWRVYTGKSH